MEGRVFFLTLIFRAWLVFVGCKVRSNVTSPDIIPLAELMECGHTLCVRQLSVIADSL